MHLKKKRYMNEERDDPTTDTTSISYGSNMADNTREVRIEEQLKVKIGEAKNLSSRNAANTSCSTQGTRDVYCTIALDQEEICRTPTIERTLSPFFGEEYQFKIPRRFRYLSVYVWDRDRHMKQDKPIGKIAIKREELHMYNHKDHWFSLRPVDSDSEVQGMAHIEVQFEDTPSQIHEQRINLLRPGDYERSNSDMIEELVQHQALQNDYKENSELSNIQRSNAQKGGIRTTSVGSTSSGGLFGNNQHQNTEHGTNWKNTSLTTAGGKHSRVTIRVPECTDLAKKNGTCDPYVVCTALYSNKRQISKRTKLRKKTVNPEFDELMSFDLCIDSEPTASAKSSHSQYDSSSGGGTINSNKAYTIYPVGGADLCEITVTVWHDASGMSDKVFLGEVKLPMRNKQQQCAVQPSAWYYLQPRSLGSTSRTVNTNTRSCATPPGTRLSGDSTIGSLRLKILYTADHVFPLATYDDLMNLLLESVDQRPIMLSSVFILGELVSCKTDVSQPLVRLFTHTGRIAPIIKALADHEISNLTDPTTIFRGNTLVSKMMDEAMRLSGLHYLHQTLRPVLAQILAEKKPCEIDPSKVKDRSAVDTNLHHLQDYVERVFEAITKSAVRCPKVLCQIFHDLRECAGRHFPHNREVRYSVVSGFIFLRFFAPAILGPKLFDLTTEPLDCQTNRTLTLISKTIQSLGNLVSSRSSQQPCKEEYTGQLYKKFCTEKHVEAVKTFLESISTPCADEVSPTHETSSLFPVGENNLEPVLLKEGEGMMTKYPQCRKRFGRRPFKQRYFRLTTQSLSYAKSKGKQTICDIPLAEIERVEQLNEKSFKMQNCFKIVRKERSLIVQTTNCVEEREWIDLLHKICLTNSIRSQYFHPSAFVNGVYSCCDRSDENAPGCKNVSPEAMDYFQMDLITALDPALDLQRIHTLIMSHMTQLEVFLDQTVAFHQIQQQHNPLVATAMAFQQQSAHAYGKFKATIMQLREVAYVIDKDHRNYKQGIARELKYGSRQAPIGDDNYLHMMRAAGHMNLQQQQQQQHQQMQQQQQVLPQMQLVMAYPYHQQQQQQQLQQHGNMNAYFMHNLQSAQQQQQQRQQHQQQPFYQQQTIQQQQQLNNNQHHLLRAAAMVHHHHSHPTATPSSSNSSTTSSVAPTLTPTSSIYLRDTLTVERYANKC
ncbi:GTPase-activating protein isoform X1 [Lucilia sericata]|uniref:GTPase-activating protein isoform X1 n=1 Tax=Lucilia sericata TaxID=13632 RepID=UPI0018A8004F|nr:GTPase-activating protein isoform X1 [Lucilia sericata]XP_037806138.1 GTPase-activating protein isoform X1 [Lucilia sericata]XP_037806210.1 GTPase-activating protein isoform X1 [Lucilia sericata]